MWLEQQRRFATFLLTGDRMADADRAMAPRTDLIRRSMLSGLVESLGAHYPVTKRIVGDDFFDAMAGAFIQCHPPRSPVLLTYGGDLANFIETFAPAAQLPYLADFVRLEDARVQVYHASDASLLSAEKFLCVEPTDLGCLTFAFQPAIKLVVSNYPIATIWAIHASNERPQPISNWTGEAALIYRRHFRVEVEKLTPEIGSFFCALLGGRPLGDAAEAAMYRNESFNLTDALTVVLRAGVIGTTKQR